MISRTIGRSIIHLYQCHLPKDHVLKILVHMTTPITLPIPLPTMAMKLTTAETLGIIGIRRSTTTIHKEIVPTTIEEMVATVDQLLRTIITQVALLMPTTAVLTRQTIPVLAGSSKITVPSLLVSTTLTITLPVEERMGITTVGPVKAPGTTDLEPTADQIAVTIGTPPVRVRTATPLRRMTVATATVKVAQLEEVVAVTVVQEAIMATAEEVRSIRTVPDPLPLRPTTEAAGAEVVGTATATVTPTMDQRLDTT